MLDQGIRCLRTFLRLASSLFLLRYNFPMNTTECRHHAHPHAHARWLPRMDAFGSLAALICAVHCAFLPLAAVAMPLAAVEVLGSHRLELYFVIFASLFGAVVLSGGLSRSRRRSVSALFLSGVTLLAAGVSQHDSDLLHAALMVLGGLSLGAAHALNRHSVLSRNDAEVLWQRLRPARALAAKAID